MTTQLTIDPITRLEGHGKIEIFLDDDGRRRQHLLPDPRAARLRALLRRAGRSRRCRSLTNRICGVCPEAHHMAAAKAADAVYHVDAAARRRKLLRELLYTAFYVTDHTTHFYALGGPDFIMGPDAPVAERNILGVIHKVGLRGRRQGHPGAPVRPPRHRDHRRPARSIPCTGDPGRHDQGHHARRSATRSRRSAGWMVDFAGFSLELFDDIVLGNQAYARPDPGRPLPPRDLLHRASSTRTTRSTSTTAGSASSPRRRAHRQVRARASTRDWIAEHVEPWTYLKFPYLRRSAGRASSTARTPASTWSTPLSRLNAADGMATPRAQEEYERFYATLSPDGDGRASARSPAAGDPLGAPDRAAATPPSGWWSWRPTRRSPRPTSAPSRRETPTEGVGTVEAPRGTLTHHYWTDERGIVTQRQPHRRHDQQLRAHRDVHRQGGARA